MSANRRFVQFPHPGAEHRADRGYLKAWNKTDRSHARKFLELSGRWTDGIRTESGALWAWGEWEPESQELLRLKRPTSLHPRSLWRPYWRRPTSYAGLHNTDPFIYGGFYYTDCKQAESASLEGLRCLDAGSVIVFGSAKKPHWVIDTVLVVKDYVDHDRSNYPERVAGRVPEGYEEVVLEPTYANPAKSPRRLYVGATVDDPVDGMFSFFPCIPAGGDVGFARPTITLPSPYFTEGLLQGAKGHSLKAPPLDAATVREQWNSMVDQVIDQGLRLGVAAEMPPQLP